MTVRWAATNTLREALTGDGAYSRYYRGQTQWDQFSAEVGKERDALALVEAALDAADKFIETMGKHQDSGEPRGYTYQSNAAAVDLAAALRAVREGK